MSRKTPIFEGSARCEQKNLTFVHRGCSLILRFLLWETLMRLVGEILKSRAVRHQDRFAESLATLLIFFVSFFVGPRRAIRFCSDVNNYSARIMDAARIMPARFACCVSKVSAHRFAPLALTCCGPGQPIDRSFSIRTSKKPLAARPRGMKATALRFLQTALSSNLVFIKLGFLLTGFSSNLHP